MLICDGLAFGKFGGGFVATGSGVAPFPVSTPGALEGSTSGAGKGGLSGPAIFPKMNGVLEGK